MIRALRRRLPAERDRGFTLTELITVMFIMGIVISAVAALSIGFIRTNSESVNRQTQLDAARMAVERLSETLRTAVKPSQLTSSCLGVCGDVDAFMQGKDLSVQFYANLDNPGNSVGPTRISYTVATSGVDAGVLVETAQTPDDADPSTPSLVDPGPDGYVYCDATATGASAECKSHLHVRRLAEGVTTTQPIFRFYGPDGNRLQTGGAALTSDELDKVLSIELYVTVQRTGAYSAKPTTYIQRVTLPNAQAVLRQGEDEDS